ncbi:hypothetical protein [Labrys neptuniae]
MTNIELMKVEEQEGGRLLFSVRVPTAAGKMEFPIAVEDQGSQALNEIAVLRSTIVFAEEMEASVRRRLGAATH